MIWFKIFHSIKHGTVCGLLLVALNSNEANAQLILAQPARVIDWVQNYVYRGVGDDNAMKSRLEGQYQHKIDLIHSVCNLTVEQREKLKLAGAHDVNRFFRDVSRLRIETAGLTQNNQEDLQKAWNLLQPLYMRLNKGLFEKGSLFDNVMSVTLTGDQRKPYEELLARKRESQQQAITRNMVSELEERVPLVDKQRSRLLELLDSQKVAVKRINNLNQNFEYLVGYAKLVKIEKKQLEEFLDRDQMAVIEKVRQQHAGNVQMFEF